MDNVYIIETRYKWLNDIPIAKGPDLYLKFCIHANLMSIAYSMFWSGD